MGMSEHSSPPSFTLPPHANAEVHKRFMEWLERATEEEKFQSLVSAGILTPEGEFTEHYRTGSDEHSGGGQAS
jgi:hypothetical protein